jgi:hypothetical protein
VRTLVSTFTEGDDDKVLLAMRHLPYDGLVLLVEEDSEGPSLDRIRKLEGLAGHEVDIRTIEADGFMPMVDSISEELSTLAFDKQKSSRNEILLNISGGSKIIGDAALLAAFRLGIEAYHCDEVVVKLPVVRGATAKDRFTELQVRLMDILADEELLLGDVIRSMQPNNKTSAERTIRELKKQGLLKSRAEGGKVILGLSIEGLEVARATRFSHRT